MSVRVLAAVAAMGLASCCPDSSRADALFLIRNPDADTQGLIDACRDPVQPDCVPLCAKLVKFPGPFDHCEMHPDHDGYMQVHVGYTVGNVCL